MDRHSSEYSKHGPRRSSSGEAIHVDEEEKKEAKGHLYRTVFANNMAKLALLPSAIMGAQPILMYFFLGRIINLMAENTLARYEGKNDDDATLKEVGYYSIGFFGVAVVCGFVKFSESFLWIRTGSYLSIKLRKDLFETMMKSEVAFFDVTPIGGILTLLSEDSQQIQDAFGTIKGMQVTSLAQFLVGIIMSFTYSWQMALIALIAAPLFAIILGILMKSVRYHAQMKFKYVSDSITIAEETLSSIRTVRGFNQEETETERFTIPVTKSSDHETILGYLISLMLFLIFVCMWGIMLSDLYFGATLVVDKKLSAGDMYSVYGYLIMGVFGVMMTQGTAQGEQKAISAGARILKLIKHIPDIPFDEGIELDNFQGKVEFKNVSFKYPTRDVYVLKNVSFVIEAGQTGALVGHSGSGKSTCIQLLERFYDVTDGFILFDGHDIRELNPRWLHRKISLVSQEPTLFQRSIKENVLYSVESATDEEVNHALEVANCNKFISKLSEGVATYVGEKGASLSGGQRQRVAIARAVLKKPIILMTDEATSALDAGSEKKVQEALDRVMVGMTGIIVAHRLSTIKNAAVIYVFDAGEIIEVGNHESLVAKKGFYYKLVYRQLPDEERSGMPEIPKRTQGPTAPQAPKASKKKSSSGSSDSD